MNRKLFCYWDAIVSHMNNEKEEEVHRENAPCTEEKFLIEYCKKDDNFASLLWCEFGIDMEDIKHDMLRQMILKEYDRNPPETAYTNCVEVLTREWVKEAITRDEYEDLQFMNEEKYDEKLGLNETETTI